MKECGAYGCKKKQGMFSGLRGWKTGGDALVLRQAHRGTKRIHRLGLEKVSGPRDGA